MTTTADFWELSDQELERELTLAALTTRRQKQFDALLQERRRRRSKRRSQGPTSRVDVLRRAGRSFVARTDSD